MFSVKTLDEKKTKKESTNRLTKKKNDDIFFITLPLLIMPGGHSGEEIPVPISNTEVKLSYADDTALEWESR